MPYKKTFEDHFGPKPKDSLGLCIWAGQSQGWNAGCDFERNKWREAIELIAERQRGSVQTALWGIAEMMQRNTEHVEVRLNADAIRRRTP